MKACAFFLALAITTAGPAAAADRDRTICQMMSEVHRLQARMAVGDKSAYASEQERLRATGAAIVSARPDTWKVKSETDAAADYVLSGGQPRDIARLLESVDVPASEDSLLRGALAYASGRAREAQALLGGLDPTKASLRLASQLAYAQSVLVTERDPGKAAALLDIARLLAPGSLVEEAALRREILIVGDSRDSDRLMRLSRQYVTRFGQSIYAESFIQGLATASTRYGLSDDGAALQKFSALLSMMSPDRRRLFLSTVARAQLLNGKLAVAGAAAREALKYTLAGSPEEASARMIAAASQIVTREYELGVGALEAVDRSRLGKSDQELLAAISSTAARLRDPPTEAALAEAGRENEVAAARSPGAAEREGADPVDATLARGRRALVSAAAVGGGASP
jgi:chemotaxis protein MotC